MTRIASALITNNQVSFIRKNVNDLPFTFVTPLGAD